MTDNLLSTIATDLNISQLDRESDIDFINRVLYSAMACWIKTVTQDISINENYQNVVSKKHI